MNKSRQMYEVEIKSMALIREGKKGLITYFKGGNPELIASNVRYLYPQYMNADDKPTVNITPIKRKEYEARLSGKQIVQKQDIVNTQAHVMKVEDYEAMGN